MRRLDRTALIAGVIFIVLGVLFLLEQLDVLDVRSSFVAPIVLVGIGIGMLVGRGDGHREPPPPPPPPPPAPEPPAAPVT
jgi:hypothetical protein